MLTPPLIIIVVAQAILHAFAPGHDSGPGHAPPQPPAPRAARPVGVGQPAPAFVLTDASGKKRSFSEFRGRPAVLWFFCGCSWCADVARKWAPLQRTGALESATSASATPAKEPITLIVYQGSAEEVNALSTAAGLDPNRTVLLPDREMTATAEVYQADPCPRVFVIDSKGIIRYINNGKDDVPRVAPAMLIVSRAVDALRLSNRELTRTKKKPAGSKPAAGRK